MSKAETEGLRALLARGMSTPGAPAARDGLLPDGEARSGLQPSACDPLRGLNRRGFIGAVIAVAATPAAPLPVMAEVVAPVTVETNLLAWLVGSPGEMDWHFIKAPTEVEAKRLWASGYSYGRCRCEPGADEDDRCEFCCVVETTETARVPQFDARNADSITSADWMRAGFTTFCDRCGYETDHDCCGNVIGGVAVCEDCTTLAEWDVIDPERAADMRADLEDDGAAPCDRSPSGEDAQRPSAEHESAVPATQGGAHV